MEFITSLAFVQAFILDGDVKVRVFELTKIKSLRAFNLTVINRRSVFAPFAQGFVFWLPCWQSRFDLSEVSRERGSPSSFPTYLGKIKATLLARYVLV